MTIKELWTNILAGKNYRFTWTGDILRIQRQDTPDFLVTLHKDIALNYTDFVVFITAEHVAIYTY
jgi:hypothetical protein